MKIYWDTLCSSLWVIYIKVHIWELYQGVKHWAFFVRGADVRQPASTKIEQQHLKARFKNLVGFGMASNIQL